MNLHKMVYPSKSGIDAWGELGNSDWNWDKLAPYYRKFHTFTSPSKEAEEFLSLRWIDKMMHGTSGPIKTSYGKANGPLEKAWPETFKNLGFQMNGDPISGKAIGGYAAMTSVDPVTRTRSYAGSGYYSPNVAQRTNLDVLTEAMVTRIILNEDVASGVEFVKNGTHIINAKEVILAAGALQSPQLLELSGIGSSEILEAHGINVLVDNPNVGENLQDHATVGLSFEVIDGLPTGDMSRDPEVRKAAMSLYQKDKSGPMGGGFSLSAYLPVVDSDEGLRNLQQLLRENNGSESIEKKRQYDLIRALLQDPTDASIHYFLAPLQLNVAKGPSMQGVLGISTPGNYVTIYSSLSHPFSRGSVHINSSNAAKKPTLDPRYLSHPLDLEVLARHVRFVGTIAETEPLASYIKKDGRRIPESLNLSDLESAKKLVTESCFSSYHPCGTCSMMSKDLGGVVNERLIVYGTKNLRIVDASVFPLEPRANIQSTVYAVAERAADIIKEDLYSKTHFKGDA